jgi:AcrR family transcriptional regulator
MVKTENLISDDMSLRIIDTAEHLALNYGVSTLNVRKILQILNITNRVFYNRFRNIEEVLDIVYKKTALKIRESIISKFDENGDFFEQIINIVASTLIMSYDNKMNLNQFVFESDSSSQDNYNWWKGEIVNLIELGKRKGLLKNVNSDTVSYAVWCFIRGYNVDALSRKLPKDIAVENFKYSFGLFLDGMKK